MSTIREVAGRAGVSTSTVSHYLNKTKVVGPDLQARIEEAMASLGYLQPDSIARSLRSGQTGSIGVVIDDIAGYRHNPVLKGIASTLNRQGLTLMLRNSNGDWGREADHIHNLIAHQVDGVIINSIGVEHDGIERLRRFQIPFVLMENAPCSYQQGIPAPNTGLVMYRADEGSRTAARHILSLGHRAVGLLGADSDSLLTAQFLEGYRDAMTEAGLRPDADATYLTSTTHDSGRFGLFQLLRQRTPITAVFVTDSRLLAGALNGIYESGLRCPDDISVIAFGHLDWADAIEPPLTVLTGDGFALGQESAALLLRLIAGRSPELPRCIYLPTELIHRSSVGPPRRAELPDGPTTAHREVTSTLATQREAL